MAGERTGVFAIEKLRGSENYQDWAFAMQLYLEHEDLWTTVRAPPGSTALETDPKKVKRARSKIILMTETCCYTYTKDTVGAKDAWDNLEAAYHQGGFSWKCSLLIKFAVLQLAECTSEEEYINRKMLLRSNLVSAGLQVDDEWFIVFLLAGLPKEYEPMRQTLSNYGEHLTSDIVKNKILHEVKFFSSGDGIGDNLTSGLYAGPGFRGRGDGVQGEVDSAGFSAEEVIAVHHRRVEVFHRDVVIVVTGVGISLSNALQTTITKEFSRETTITTCIL